MLCWAVLQGLDYYLTNYPRKGNKVLGFLECCCRIYLTYIWFCISLQGLDYYLTNYPTDGDKVLGFLDYQLLLLFQLDHIYSAWYFYAAIALLGASLMACTYTTQLPTAKVSDEMLCQ
jgi:hypothetical protein